MGVHNVKVSAKAVKQDLGLIINMTFLCFTGGHQTRSLSLRPPAPLPGHLLPQEPSFPGLLLPHFPLPNFFRNNCCSVLQPPLSSGQAPHWMDSASTLLKMPQSAGDLLSFSPCLIYDNPAENVLPLASASTLLPASLIPIISTIPSPPKLCSILQPSFTMLRYLPNWLNALSAPNIVPENNSKLYLHGSEFRTCSSTRRP